MNNHASLVQRIEHPPSKRVILVRFQEEAPSDPDDEEEDDIINHDDSTEWLTSPGLLAQWLEQSPHKGLVVGSNPSEPTTLIK